MDLSFELKVNTIGGAQTSFSLVTAVERMNGNTRRRIKTIIQVDQEDYLLV